jgi:hypothetical protein
MTSNPNRYPDLTPSIVAAEEVRTARIRTIKADRQHCWAIGSTVRHDVEIAALEAVSADVILDEFMSSTDREQASDLH